ncbi:hypothetical protein [Gaoshiqia sp. Z1-71]|uniref:hypothetical protein n=1 Tax=Gaoshiqia hydrogeniformans TaxID=3290090 RepID=UPI003BF9201F
MTTLISNKFTKKILPAILLATIILFVASCDTTVPFLTSSVVPAATGTVKIKKDNNQNYAIKVQIENLAEVERLQSSKQMYIVWMETEHGNAENLGQLNSSSGFISKKISASLETVSSFKPVRFFVTTEFNQNVRYPGAEDILTTDRFDK